MSHVVHDPSKPRLGCFLGMRVYLWHVFGRIGHKDNVAGDFGKNKGNVSFGHVRRVEHVLVLRAHRRAVAQLGRLTRQRLGRAVAEEGGQPHHRLVAGGAVGMPSVAKKGEVAMN